MTGKACRRPRLVIVLKGYPRLSETFIAQEIFGLEREGLAPEIVSLRHPTDPKRHSVHDQISAPVTYLPEYLYQEPGRVLRGLVRWIASVRFWRSFGSFLVDLARDPTPNRVRRFGQALVLAAEIGPGDVWLHAHFAHTPASVARYAARLLDAPFTISAHAKDIWTSAAWDLRDKLTDARWTVTCTRKGQDYLAGLAPGAAVHLSYHGLDLGRFPASDAVRPARDGSDPDDPVILLSVGRAVPKKGYHTLLRALSLLPGDLHWRFVHIGSGPELPNLKNLAQSLDLQEIIEWRGAQDQADVLAAYRAADVFALASRESADGDRDGLPNVIVEAASQGLACVATRFSAIPEFLDDGESGLLVPPEDAPALAQALERAITDPGLRARLGAASEDRVRREFDFLPGIRRLRGLFEDAWAAAR